MYDEFNIVLRIETTTNLRCGSLCWPPTSAIKFISEVETPEIGVQKLGG